MKRIFALIFLANFAFSAVQEFDTSVCSINGVIITRGDVSDRVQIALAGLKREGVSVKTKKDLQALHEKVLDKLVEEELIIQEAQRLQLILDPKRMKENLLRQAKERGLPTNIHYINEALKHEIKQATINQIIMFYERATPKCSPQSMREYYKANIDKYTRPGQKHLWRIVLPMITEAQKARILSDMKTCMKHIRGSKVAETKSLVTGKTIEAILDADDDGQIKILKGIIDKLLSLKNIKKEKGLFNEAMALKDLSKYLWNKEQAKAEADKISSEIQKLEVAKRLNAFKQKAKEFDIANDGDLGLIEDNDGSQSELVEKTYKNKKAGFVSDAFWSADACVIIMVSEVKEALQQSFLEVSAAIERRLDYDKRELAKKVLIEKLKKEAQIIMIK